MLGAVMGLRLDEIDGENGGRASDLQFLMPDECAEIGQAVCATLRGADGDTLR